MSKGINKGGYFIDRHSAVFSLSKAIRVTRLNQFANLTPWIKAEMLALMSLLSEPTCKLIRLLLQ